jgi:hypothetical protein
MYQHEGLYLLAQAQFYSVDITGARASINKLKEMNKHSLIDISKKIEPLENILFKE